MARSKSGAADRRQLRIIGGQWRGRKLFFTAAPGLRPTPDRVRETLFNWLAPDIAGAQCLDLFAGSGALGLEALSRGAAHCTFVDTSNEVIKTIDQQLFTLDASNLATCTALSAEQFLHSVERPFDIVFLDPPFQKGFIEPIAALLEERRLIEANAIIYTETHASEPAPSLPSRWQPYRDKRAGDVQYRLFTPLS
ncbi:MAG: 16S rRNA (guanine(966)-N(2))-methyltransferase RsmD [Halioglobus sp.]